MPGSIKCPHCEEVVSKRELGIQDDDVNPNIAADMGDMQIVYMPDPDATITCPSCQKEINRLEAASGKYNVPSAGSGCLAIVVISILGAGCYAIGFI